MHDEAITFNHALQVVKWLQLDGVDSMVLAVDSNQTTNIATYMVRHLHKG